MKVNLKNLLGNNTTNPLESRANWAVVLVGTVALLEMLQQGRDWRECLIAGLLAACGLMLRQMKGYKPKKEDSK